MSASIRISGRRELAWLAGLLALGALGSLASAETTLPASAATAGPVVRLISTQQYKNAISDVFGLGIDDPIGLPPLIRTGGLMSLGAAAATVTPGVMETFDSTALTIAAQVVSEANRAYFMPCRPAKLAQPDDRCAGRFLSKVGSQLFRRPLTAREQIFYVRVAHEATLSTKDFYSGLSYALTGLLVAPDFIYLVEQTEPDPARPGRERLDSPSRALRLSLLLWNAPPDEELQRAAREGELFTVPGLRRQVDRMMASRRLEDGVRAFFADMLLMEKFDVLSKEPSIYPRFTGKTAADAREQLMRTIVDQLLIRDGDYRDLFTTRHTFLTQNLASLYGIPVAIGPNDWMAYDLPAEGARMGILTQIGFLATFSHAGRSSPTLRGKAIREVFMCQRIPPPPPNVDFTAVRAAEKTVPTARERLEIHRTNAVCAGCHKKTDPIGLALENFDGAGEFRATEKGAVIDSSGSFDGVKYSDIKGFTETVRENAAVPACLVKRLYQYGKGRDTTDADDRTLAELKETFKSSGYRFTALLRALASSDALFDVGPQALLQHEQVAALESKR